MKIENKKTLVVGGTGFIGSHIVDELVKKGYSVIVLDDLSKGTVKNLEWAKENGDVEFVKGTVEDYDLVKEVVGASDIIFHQAALNLIQSTNDPRKDLLVNTLGTLNILEAMKELQTVDIMVYASTGSIYGEPEYNPQDENHPLKPTSPYGISKLAAEKYVILWNKLYGLNTVALRYYNVYGPRQDYSEIGGVIPIFIKTVLQNKPPIIEGDGLQERCFTYVSDVVRANILAAEHESAWGRAYNIGTNEITTIKDLASIIISLDDKELEPIFAPPRVGDIQKFMPDITLAKRYLEYAPQITLEDGLPSVIEWLKEELGVK